MPGMGWSTEYGLQDLQNETDALVVTGGHRTQAVIAGQECSQRQHVLDMGYGVEYLLWIGGLGMG